MDKAHAIDALIESVDKVTYLAEQTSSPLQDIVEAENEFHALREKVLDSIKVFCDCGKGDDCPTTYHNIVDNVIQRMRETLRAWYDDPWNPKYGVRGFEGVIDTVQAEFDKE